ncbi:hypothetical protein JHK82_021799 [Glycine max]|uniref:high mobility group B protein 14 isoform X2 n=1 Tax=Glycine max TaxID=3847 RepID=UPI0003DE8483|nr:high mobility group B protein 14 isoform X2 [Glycine max]XP_028244374.1 high mobility group B protein 14-like isoform X2 [Glycine soja]KAG5137068.1 hypothetical protein JHK82_021799 [Glycine max]KAH1237717.1 High mobility group B protein 14 [Glycine max]|eukprot:XP_006585506.1 high mobility group B protein 14 isoform X2 [Glycine max]
MKLEYEREEEEDNKRENQLLDWTTMKIGNAFGKKWISMTNEEKVKYYDIASEKRIEFDRAMAEFNNKMPLTLIFSRDFKCFSPSTLSSFGHLSSIKVTGVSEDKTEG